VVLPTVGEARRAVDAGVDIIVAQDVKAEATCAVSLERFRSFLWSSTRSIPSPLWLPAGSPMDPA
jgi:hypothetical protein